MADTKLSIALMRRPWSEPIIDGSVRPEGACFLPTVADGSEIFWRQLKFRDFDVSEMSLSSLTISIAKGSSDWIGIPIFTRRSFFHTDVLVSSGSGIERPMDLAGKRVGVPEYQQTAALWARGVLSDEFGVDPRSIRWFMERGRELSHGGSTGFTPPPGVSLEYIPASTDIGAMMLAGELDATLLYIPFKNVISRSSADLQGARTVRPLFHDKLAEGKRYFAKTGVFPINHCFAINRSLADRDPSLARRIYTAFAQAKELAAQRRRRLLAPLIETGALGESEARLDSDVMPYGVRGGTKALETALRFLREQGLVARRVGIDELFAPATLET
jgi:4,5-dihydroxyphthalate decarboxylase